MKEECKEKNLNEIVYQLGNPLNKKPQKILNDLFKKEEYPELTHLKYKKYFSNIADYSPKSFFFLK